jgi:predicted O-methyltransferase YrrM
MTVTIQLETPLTAADYEFSNDWFVGNIPVWDALIPRYEPKRIIEIGSYEGRSTCHLIEKLSDTRAIEIHCIDSWEGGVEHDRVEMSSVEMRFDKNIQIAAGKAKNPPKIVKHKSFSNAALAKLLTTEPPSSFDLIYIDGSHQAPDVLTDCVMAFQLLRKGGLMIFDDYIWSMEEMGKQDVLNMPKIAIDAFLNIFQRKMVIVRGAPVYQLYAVKTAL